MSIKPILHLPFNGNANDVSGNGNHGTVVGASLTEDRFGRPNEAYSYTSDYIDCGNDEIFDLTTEFTMSAWVYGNNINNDIDVIGKDLAYLFRFKALNSGKMEVVLRSGNSWHFSSLTTSEIDDTHWHNVIVTYDSSYLKIYVDGVLEVDDSMEYTLDVSTSNLFVGSRTSTIERYTGKLDDIRIYDRALTYSQVKQLYNDTKRKYGRN